MYLQEKDYRRRVENYITIFEPLDQAEMTGERDYSYFKCDHSRHHFVVWVCVCVSVCACVRVDDVNGVILPSLLLLSNDHSDFFLTTTPSYPSPPLLLLSHHH